MDDARLWTADWPPKFFISRSGMDKVIAQQIAEILEEVGQTVILQDWDFKHKSFMGQMQAALTSGAKTLALLSEDYLKSKHCEAEWQATIADDPLNDKANLIVLRVRACHPTGLLKPISYTDLSSLAPGHDGNLLRELVLAAITPSARKLPDHLKRYVTPARTLLHPNIAATPNFTGRDGELKQIKGALAQEASAAITPVHGMGGVGKTTLAREYAWRLGQENHYAGIWWINAEKAPGVQNWPGIEQGLIDLRRELYPALPEPKEREPAAREMLRHLEGLAQSKPWLLVYDNADDIDVAEQDNWKPPANVQVLITSRLSKWRSGVKGVELDEWKLEDAIAYLKKESARSDLSDADAARIANELGCLPLALSHAAAYLREVDTATADSYLARLATHLASVPETADAKTRAVTATLLENVAQAEARAKGATAILRLAGFFAPDDIPEELFQQDADETYPEELRAVLSDPLAYEKATGALGRLSLLDYRRDTKTFSVHRLVQTILRNDIGQQHQIWAGAALRIANAIFPHVAFSNWASCARLLPHALAASEYYGNQVCYRLARLLNQMAFYLYQQAEYIRAEPLFEHALTILTHLLGPQHVDVATVLNHLGNLNLHMGRQRAAQSFLERSLAIRENVLGPDAPDVGIVLGNLACVLIEQHDLGRALPLRLRELAIMEKAHHAMHPCVATACNNLAAIYHDINKPDLAEPLYKRSIEISEQSLVPDHPEVGDALNNLAELYRAQGKYDLAEPLYKRSLAIREKALGPDHPDVAMSLNNLAALYHAQDQCELAEAHYKRSIVLLKNSPQPNHAHLGLLLNNLALLYYKMGQLTGALLCAQEAVDLLRDALGNDHPKAQMAAEGLAIVEASLKAKGR